jgi:hypothetical protein
VSLRPLQVQWNPETIAGLQSFLSDRRRRAPSSPPPRTRRSSAPSTTTDPPGPTTPDKGPTDVRGSSRSPSDPSTFHSHASAGSAPKQATAMRPVRLRCTTGRVTLRLNKEGEQRRMLDLTLATAELRFHAQVHIGKPPLSSPWYQICMTHWIDP